MCKRSANTAITQLFTGYQTKYKGNKFHGISSTCPCCTSSEETLTHVFTCASTEATCNCSSQVDFLQAALTKMGTPPSFAVLRGIQEWSISQNEVGHRIRPNSCGSVIPAMIILTQAFIEQTEITRMGPNPQGVGQHQVGSAYTAFKGGSRQVETASTTWVMRLITSLWDYSTAMWKHRNSDVHGVSAVEAQQKALAALHTQVETADREFDTDPFVVSPKHNSLFTKKSLQDRLRMSHDSLAAWLRSVKEAVTYQEVIKSSMAKATKNFFTPKQLVHHPVHLPRY